MMIRKYVEWGFWVNTNDNLSFFTFQIVEHLIPLSELLDLGFDEIKISDALVKFNNNKEKALDFLISQYFLYYYKFKYFLTNLFIYIYIYKFIYKNQLFSVYLN